ncbi:MAG: succinate dehydrogenase assembly factor 2 [Pseudomonadota bacterium]
MSQAPALDDRRRKLIYRASHRGTKEMDLVLGGYVQKVIGELTEAEVDELEAIIALPDPTLTAWLMGHEPVTPEFDTKLMASILSFSYKPADYS